MAKPGFEFFLELEKAKRAIREEARAEEPTYNDPPFVPQVGGWIVRRNETGFTYGRQRPRFLYPWDEGGGFF